MSKWEITMCRPNFPLSWLVALKLGYNDEENSINDDAAEYIVDKSYNYYYFFL